MEFLKPNWLWGLCALALPVIIHFWYQKRGETIWWATNQWLSEKTSLKHRGIRLDEIPLMLIRCLLLVILVAILSQPVLHFFSDHIKKKRVHLLENNIKLIENFRFEIETAIKNGEKIYLIGSEPEELKSFEAKPGNAYSDIYLQQSIQTLASKETELHLYLSNNLPISTIPKIYIPASYQIHYVAINAEDNSVNYLSVENGMGLFVDKTTGLLTSAEVKDIVKRYKKADLVHSGDVNVLIDIKDMQSRKVVEAALRSLETVYKLPIKMTTANSGYDSIFDLVISDRELKKYAPQTLYITTGSGESFRPNIIYLNDSLQISKSDLVRSGRLPERIGEQIVDHFRLKNQPVPLSSIGLKEKFESVNPANFQEKTFSNWLIFILLLVLLFERGIVFRKEWRNG